MLCVYNVLYVLCICRKGSLWGVTNVCSCCLCCVCVVRVVCARFMYVSGSWVCHVFVRMFNVLCMFPVSRLWACHKCVFMLFVLRMCREGCLCVFPVCFRLMGVSCVCAFVVSSVYVS